MNIFKSKFKKQKDYFLKNGYVHLGNLFDKSEVSLLKSAVDNSKEMQAHRELVKQKYDAGAHPSFETIFVMNDVFSDNIFALACRKPEIIDFISYVFNDDAYLYHSKVPLKYPNMPGFKYHQDYYYWYSMGCLFPHLATCFIAIDEATEENGCLKYIPQSHTCGRMEHVLHDGVSDSEADTERVSLLIERFGEVSAELKPGDVVVHHSNMLHASDDNKSNRSRIALLGCFNTKLNSPFNNSSDHPSYSPQKRFSGKINESHLSTPPDLTISFES